MKSQNGFAVAVVLVVVIVVAVVGFVGYKVYKSNSDTVAQPTTNTANEITSSQDITSTQNELESINLDDDLDPSVLEEDVNDLQ